MSRIQIQIILDWLRERKFLYKPYLVPTHKRNLPNFLIVGAQKSGTTALLYNLALHPEIFMARDPLYTELKFFSWEKRWKRGVIWYMGHFTRNSCLQGEKDPEYLFLQKCHSRMHTVVPKAKLIILLRNPVDRAYSQWNHYNEVYETRSKNWGWIKTDFETALIKQKEIIKRGEYINQIIHLLKFFPKEQIYIGIAERLKANPSYELSKIFSFLEVPSISLEVLNIHTRKYAYPMKEETREKLHDHFQPFNQRLFALLGHSIPEWEPSQKLKQ